MKYGKGKDYPYHYAIDSATPDGFVNERVITAQTSDLRNYVLELLNNPPDPFKKPEEPQSVGVFEFRGEKFELRGQARAIVALGELVQFYEEVIGNMKMASKGICAEWNRQNPPAQPEATYQDYNPNDTKEIFRRLDEIEKNLYVLSAQPTTAQEGERRLKALRDWPNPAPRTY